jgi:probable phosphoglycerate mutase
MARIFLIRHGENEYTRTGRLAGWTRGVALNAAGRQQAQALAAYLAATPIHFIYSSPLQRALETAQPLAKSKHLRVRVLDALGEVRYGEWQGKSLKELRLRKLWRTVQERPSQMVFPGGEALRAVQTRAVDAVELLAKRHAGQTVALFSHGDVIRVTLAHYLGTPLDLFQRIMIGTASISELTVSPQHMAVVRANFSVQPLPAPAGAK